MEYYDIEKKEFNKPQMSFRIQPEYRRNHIAELVEFNQNIEEIT